MKTLLRTNLLKLVIIGLITALALMVFDYRWSFGFLLGFLFSFITVKRTEAQVDSILFYQKKGILLYLSFILGNLIYVIPFVISLFFNNYFNLIFVGFGLLFFKYYIFVTEIFFRKKENEWPYLVLAHLKYK